MDKVVLLLVDDDIDDQSLFLEAIHNIDKEIECFIAGDGRQALEFLQNCQSLPHFIFLDLNMPRMGGKKCLQEIKKNGRFSEISVIVTSTSRREDEVAEIAQLGAAFFMQKPVLFAEFQQEIARIIYGENYQVGNLVYSTS